MNLYIVTATRWDRGWELAIRDDSGNDVGVTQSHSLAAAKRMVSDYLALDGITVNDENIDIRPELDAALTDRIAETQARIHELDELQHLVASTRRAVARDLVDAGFKGAEIAAILKLSPQRVSQLVNS